MRLPRLHVRLDALQVPDGQVIGGVRVSLVGGHPEILHGGNLVLGHSDAVQQPLADDVLRLGVAQRRVRAAQVVVELVKVEVDVVGEDDAEYGAQGEERDRDPALGDLLRLGQVALAAVFEQGVQLGVFGLCL